MCLSVEQADVIDIVSTDPNSGEVTMTITDHLRWDGHHVGVLNKKLAAYSQFVKRGGLEKSYEVPKGARVKFLVLLKYRPDVAGMNFLNAAKKHAQSQGVELEFKPIPDLGYQDDAS
jgi:hypothetical protein